MKWNPDKLDWNIETGYIRTFSYPDKESLNVIKNIYLSEINGFDKN